MMSIGYDASLNYLLLIDNDVKNEKILAKKIFIYSIPYLFLIFLIILIDSVIA